MADNSVPPIRTPFFDGGDAPEGRAAVGLLGRISRIWVSYFDALGKAVAAATAAAAEASAAAAAAAADTSAPVSGPLSIDAGATPAESQLKIAAAGAGALEALSYSADNQELLFDCTWTGSALLAASANVARIIKNAATWNVYGATGQTVGSPAVDASLLSIDLATGNGTFAGIVKGTAFSVGAHQVVGAQGAAVAAPAGGGTVVAAPVGGATVDVQARTAIAAIIVAISATGNTIDPAARTAINAILARLSESSGGHGLIA